MRLVHGQSWAAERLHVAKLKQGQRRLQSGDGWWRQEEEARIVGASSLSPDLGRGFLLVRLKNLAQHAMPGRVDIKAV